jgi:hypothetical protein
VDERAHARNDQHHQHRERIHAEGPAHAQVADADPIHQRNGRAFGAAGQAERQQDGHHERAARSQAGQHADAPLTQPLAHQQVQHQPDGRQEHHPWNKGKIRVHQCSFQLHILLLEGPEISPSGC